MADGIDPEIFKDINDETFNLVGENGIIIDETKLQDLSEKIKEQQKGVEQNNFVDVIKGQDGSLELTKGGEILKFEGKSFGKFLFDFRTETIEKFGEGQLDVESVNQLCDNTGRKVSEALIGSDGLSSELSGKYEINIRPDLEQKAQEGFNPPATSEVSETQVNELVQEVKSPEEAQKNSQNPTVELMEKLTGLQDKIDSWKEEAKKQGVETKEYIDGKLDELEKRLRDKLPTETQKSTLERIIEGMKILIQLTGFGLAAYLTVAELKKHANEKSGCFVDFVDGKNKKPKSLYKIKQLTCDPEYRDVKPSNMEWADNDNTFNLSKDCISNPAPPPNPSGCNNCNQELTTKKNCPCADSENFVSLFCSNNYMANPDSQSSIIHNYHSEKMGILDAFNDLAAYFIEIGKEVANDAAQGFGDLLKNLFKFIEYGAIIVGVIILIYVVLKLFGIIGESGGSKEVKVDIESGHTSTSPIETTQIVPPKQISTSQPTQPEQEKKSLDEQDPLELLSKIQRDGIKAAASEAGIVQQPRYSAKSVPVVQQSGSRSPGSGAPIQEFSFRPYRKSIKVSRRLIK